MPAFAEQMNEKAKKIGCESTHFVTPNGLDGADEGGAHGTTAEDLARIMKYCTWDSSEIRSIHKDYQRKAAYVHKFVRNKNLYLLQS